MSVDFSAFDIRSLANLLSQHNNDNSDSDNETESQPGAASRMQGPGDIGVLPKENERKSESKEKETSNESSSKPNAKDSSTKNKNSIWTTEEVSKEGDNDEGINLSLIGDPRVNPQYDMHYRQSVSAEDVFLQMGGKTPGTASCEELIVEIHLPDEDYHKVELNLKKQLIDLSSPIYFLHLGLPHPIDPRAGNAKWDQNKEKLTITLKLAREFDDLNF